MISRSHNAALVIAVLIFSITIINSCSLFGSRDDEGNELADGTEEGYRLAKQHCSSCHLFVNAKTLNRNSWLNKVLPGMASRLGIGVFGRNDYINNPDYGSGQISFENWMKIVNYYARNSPMEIAPATTAQKPVKEWRNFTLKKPVRSIFPSARTTLASFDTATRSIFTSDGNTNKLYRWNKNLALTDSANIGSAAVSAFYSTDSAGRQRATFSTLGTMMANDISEGKLLVFDLDKNLATASDTLATKLPRPLYSGAADFNNDNRTDWLVCGFGHLKGGLYWLEASANGHFIKHTIVDAPGAIQAVVQDFNKDGWMDMMVLFAHDDESIRLFTNNKNGTFSSKKLLTFLPVAGSSSFQLVDMNNDGKKDILYTNGDNSDYSPVLKSFHGMHIYLNKGGENFEHSYFYPINGCTKAIAADFDEDGDLDIATIAFFADFKNNPAEKFIYFQQEKNMEFVPYSPPIEKSGRWICMDAADYDGDGDLDIILGNFARGFVIIQDYQPDWDDSSPFIVLQNETRH